MSEINRAEVRDKLIESLKYSFLNLKSITIFLLFILLVITCLMVLSTKLENRNLTIEMQKLSQQQNELQVEWTQILLEYSTLASPILVEEKATDQLEMIQPIPKEVQVIKAYQVEE